MACRSEFVTANAAGGVRVLPLDGSSIGGVGVDVAAEFASQVGNRGEDAARDDLAFDLGEPDLDLVEPGGVSGREVKPDSRMLVEELADRLSFVCGEIVEDDVNLLPRRAQGDHLLEKGDELAAGVAGGGLAVDAAGGGIERRIQGERAVPVVLEAVAFGASRRERQDGIETVQGLNGGLLIDAEHGRVLRRVQIEAEDVGGFAFELGIVAGHVAFEAVRLQARFLPNPMHGVFADAQRGGQFAATPVRGPVAGLSPGGGQDAGAQSRSQHPGLLAGMIGVQSLESVLPEALFPAHDGGRRGLELSLDRVEGRAFGQHQNQLGAKHISGGQSTGLGDAA